MTEFDNTSTDGNEQECGTAREYAAVTDAAHAAPVELIEEFKPLVEAVIFASDEPISFKTIRDVLVGGDDGDTINDDAAIEGEVESAPRKGRRPRSRRFTMNLLSSIVAGLNTEYQSRGRAFRIVELAGGFTFQTTVDYGIWVGRLFAERTKRRLTQSALETLSIIAFRQPVSKPAIEGIRGVNSDFVIKSLLERDLIAIVGRENTVGRPLLYGTTKTFLKHFGLNSLEDLPKPREIDDLLAEDDGITASIEESPDAKEDEEISFNEDDANSLFRTMKTSEAEVEIDSAEEESAEFGSTGLDSSDAPDGMHNDVSSATSASENDGFGNVDSGDGETDEVHCESAVSGDEYRETGADDWFIGDESAEERETEIAGKRRHDTRVPDGENETMETSE